MVVRVPVRGYYNEISYFYIDEGANHGFLIDPGSQAGHLLSMIQRKGWTIEKILLTHGHFDHTGAVNELRSVLGVPVLAHRRADEYLLDAHMNLSEGSGVPVIIRTVTYLDDGDIVPLDADPAFALDVIYAPGHTTDSVVYYSPKDRVAFVGDTIFKVSIGIWDFPGGNLADLQRSILEKIFTLPEDTALYSGHSVPTTVGEEKRRYGL